MNEEIFDLQAGYVKFANPVALAPMAGMTDSKFVNEHAKSAGLAIIGGYNLDEAVKLAAKAMIERGREEFVCDDPFGLIIEEISSISSGPAIAVNVRSTTIEPLLKLAMMLREKGAILELDAHCRQEEMKAVGVGEALMEDLPRLVEWIRAIKKTGVVLSVKIRAGVVDDVLLAKSIDNAGADILHVDAMAPGQGADLNALRRIRDSTRMLLIGNNSVLCTKDAVDMFSRGADMISVSRGVIEYPGLIDSLVKDITQIQQNTGWYNAPKHICRGEGDLRGLTFCCMPVKPCAVHNKIAQLGLSAKEFADLKMEFGKGTPLEYGDSTCFGSLVWCCKISKPCFLRDGVLDMIELSDTEYMRLKKDLATYILDNAKKPVNKL